MYLVVEILLGCVGVRRLEGRVEDAGYIHDPRRARGGAGEDVWEAVSEENDTSEGEHTSKHLFPHRPPLLGPRPSSGREVFRATETRCPCVDACGAEAESGRHQRRGGGEGRGMTYPFALRLLLCADPMLLLLMDVARPCPNPSIPGT